MLVSSLLLAPARFFHLQVLIVCSSEMGPPHGMGSGETGSTLEEQDDSAKMPPIDNSELCVQEPSNSKKLPSLTNEGTSALTLP